MNSCNESVKLLTHSKQKLKPTEDKRLSAKETLLAFTKRTKPDYRASWHHKTLAKMLDRVAAGNCRRLMVFMPPQHGKSELVSRRFPAWMLGQDPDLRLFAASHTHELAVAMNRDVQRIMDPVRRTARSSRVALAHKPDAQAKELAVFLLRSRVKACLKKPRLCSPAYGPG